MIEENLRNVKVDVSTASVEVAPELAYSQVRKALVITNTSTAGQIITIAFGEEAVAGQGVVLYPTGSWFETLDNRFMPTSRVINAISDAINGTVAVHERIVRWG